MNVIVNGDALDLATGTTVESLVGIVAPCPKGLAVAVNEEVVPRSLWPAVELRTNDRVEVLTPSQGG